MSSLPKRMRSLLPYAMTSTQLNSTYIICYSGFSVFAFCILQQGKEATTEARLMSISSVICFEACKLKSFISTSRFLFYGSQPLPRTNNESDKYRTQSSKPALYEQFCHIWKKSRWAESISNRLNMCFCPNHQCSSSCPCRRSDHFSAKLHIPSVCHNWVKRNQLDSQKKGIVHKRAWAFTRAASVHGIFYLQNVQVSPHQIQKSSS